MTTTRLEPAEAFVDTHRGRTVPEPIRMRRILGVELRKMFATRSGFWLMTSIAISAVLTTTAVIVFAPEEALAYGTFASAIGFPMAVILPLVAILSVTSEWSQRSGLTTFTLVPHRGRVIAAKAICAVGIGVVSTLLAAAVGAVGNIVGTTIAGVGTTWNVDVEELALFALANVLGMLVGFMLGVVLRSSAGAIVAYFVYALLLPTVSSVLASTQEWWRELAPWLDFNYASSSLFSGHMTAEQWVQLGTSGLLWLVIPLALGLRLVLRAEVT